MIPFPLLEQHLNREISAVPAFQLPLKGLKSLKTLKLQPKAARLRSAPKGSLGLELILEAQSGKRSLFELRAEGRIKPKLKQDRLSFNLGPESLRELKIRLSKESSAALLKLLLKRLPKVLIRTLSKRELRKMISRALERAIKGGYALIREHLLKELITPSRVEIRLPKLPIESISLSSQASDKQGPGFLRLSFHSSLPVQSSLPRLSPLKASQEIQLQLSAALLAELVNEGMRQGKLPKRYSQEGKADPQGALEAGMAWVEGEIPLRVLVWRREGSCLKAELGARPQVKLSSKGKLQLSAQEIQLMDLRGPALLEWGAWIYRLGGYSMEMSRSLAAETRFKLGGKALSLKISQARIEGMALSVSMDLEQR